MRRIIVEEPISRAAVWSRRLALFALAVAAIAVAIARMSGVEPTAALAVFVAALAIAGAAILLAGAGLTVIWRLGRQGAGRAFAAIGLSAALLAWPLWLAISALRLPAINDVSTDLIDPPAFARTARAQTARGAPPRDLPDAETREKQKRAYPGLEPLLLDLEAEQAFRLALRAAQTMGWRIVEQTRPGGRAGVGRIDAVDRTPVLGLPDDVTVRLRPLVGQTRIDLRSASRYGRHDLGANARRVRAFLEALQAQAEAR